MTKLPTHDEMRAQISDPRTSRVVAASLSIEKAITKTLTAFYRENGTGMRIGRMTVAVSPTREISISVLPDLPHVLEIFAKIDTDIILSACKDFAYHAPAASLPAKMEYLVSGNAGDTQVATCFAFYLGGKIIHWPEDPERFLSYAIDMDFFTDSILKALPCNDGPIFAFLPITEEEVYDRIHATSERAAAFKFFVREMGLLTVHSFTAGLQITELLAEYGLSGVTFAKISEATIEESIGRVQKELSAFMQADPDGADQVWIASRLTSRVADVP